MVKRSVYNEQINIHNIRLSNETYSILKKLKDDNGLKSYDILIKKILEGKIKNG
jgi:predicted CopG family antitoxin